jgi:hypothetical protein
MTVLTKRLAAVAALLILAGCGQVTETEQPPAPTPAETLRKGVPTTAADIFHYAISDGSKAASGIVDTANKTLTTDFNEKIPDAGFTLTMRFLVVGDDSWAKISFGSAPAGLGLPKLPKKWMKLDTKKLGAEAEKDLTYADQTDPGYIGTLVAAAAGLTEKSPGRFSGTVDLTQATEAEIVDTATLTALGEKAKTVPFEASLDAKGRISTATVKVPAAGKVKAMTYEVSYDQYGSAEGVPAPTGSAQVAAPKAAYDLLNS